MMVLFFQSKRRQEKQEAVRLLKELKSVIAVRGQQWEEREKRARLLMQTGHHITIVQDNQDSDRDTTPSDSVTASTEVEDNDTRRTTSSNSDIDIEQICDSILTPSDDPNDRTRTLLHVDEEECNTSQDSLNDDMDSSIRDLPSVLSLDNENNPTSVSSEMTNSSQRKAEKDFGFFLDDTDVSPDGELLSRYNLARVFSEATQEHVPDNIAHVYSTDANSTQSLAENNCSHSNSANIMNNSHDKNVITENICENKRTDKKGSPSQVFESGMSAEEDVVGSISDAAIISTKSTSDIEDSDIMKTDDGSVSDHLAALKDKLALNASHPWGATQANMAAMAAIKSQNFGLKVETFGDSDSDESEGVIEG